MRPHDRDTQWATVLVLEQPNIDTSLMEMVVAVQLSDFFTMTVGPETDAALHVRQTQLFLLLLFRENKAFRILFKHIERNAALQIGLHQVVKHKDANNPVKHDADKVHETMPPKPLCEHCRFSFELQHKDENSHGYEPNIIKEQQPPFQAKRVRINVKEPLSDQLRRRLTSGFHEKFPHTRPEIRPRDSKSNASKAEAEEECIRIIFGWPKLQDK